MDYDQAYDVAFQIFQTDPAEYEYYEYCMKRFSYQQKNLLQLGEYCRVDLSKITESIFVQIFNQMPHETEEETLRLNEKLIEKKNELGVSRSATIDKVAKMLYDFDVAARTFRDVTYNTREIRAKAEADHNQLTAICAKIREADKAECNRLKEEISEKGYVEQVLQPFLDQIKSRIEEIWATEDGQIFDNILINTDLQNRDAVIASIAYISSSGRTGAKNQYIDALNGFNEKNIQLAREYQTWGKKTLWQKYLLPVLLGVVGFLSTPALGPFGLLACIAGIAWLIWALVKSKRTKTAWELLTVHGTAIHPVLITSPDEAKQ